MYLVPTSTLTGCCVTLMCEEGAAHGARFRCMPVRPRIYPELAEELVAGALELANTKEGLFVVV